MDKSKLFRFAMLGVSGLIGAAIAVGWLPTEPWAAIATGLGAWQVPALGHAAKGGAK